MRWSVPWGSCQILMVLSSDPVIHHCSVVSHARQRIGAVWYPVSRWSCARMTVSFCRGGDVVFSLGLSDCMEIEGKCFVSYDGFSGDFFYGMVMCGSVYGLW